MPDPVSLPQQDTFATALTRAIAERNLTLDRLSAKLRAAGTPVSIATLSYWQTGRSVPTRTRSRKAVEHLEGILEVQPGQLVRSLPGDPFGRWDPQAAIEPQERLMKALEKMGLDLNRHSSSLSIQEQLTISPDGLRRHNLVRQLIRSEEDGLNRTLGIFTELSEDGDAPGIEAGRGCRIGEVTVLDEERMTIAEILLDKTLQRGDLLMFDYAVQWESNTRPATSFERTLASGVPFLTLEANFQGEPPPEAAYYTCPRVDSPDSEISYTPLEVGHHLQFSIQNAPVGVHGLGWRFEPEETPS